MPGIPAHALRGNKEPYDAARYFAYMARELQQLLDVIEPVEANLHCFGNRPRNMLLTICTEVENQFRGILRANGIDQERYTTSDFVRLLEPMRLAEYSILFSSMPWLGKRSPFAQWDPDLPTQSLPWYFAYNATKHDRAANAHRGNLSSVLDSLAALWVLLCAQYGEVGWDKPRHSRHFIDYVRYPRWRYSETYIHPIRDESKSASGRELLRPIPYFS